MSDTYKIGTVTVAALGGGWYTLTHASLTEPKKVHGKEAADAEAAKLDETPEGHIQPQGALPDPVPPPPEAPAKPAEEASEIEQLKAQLAASEEKNAALQASQSDFETRFNDFLKSAQPLIASIGTTDGALPGVPGRAPREYSGQMDPATKAMFKKAGIKVLTIVLEENESIPPTGLFVGHNGNSYMIVPGEEVDVPDFLLGVLDDAVTSSPTVEAKTNKVLGYRNRSKYPYRLVK